MKATFDTTWYVPATSAVADAECATEVAAFKARYAIGHIYVVEFMSGVVKVGKTADPRARLAAHAQLALTHGGAVKSTWISRRLVAYAEAERELIALCSRHGTLLTGREYFAIDAAKARTFASIIDHNRLRSEQLSTDALALLGEDVAA